MKAKVHDQLVLCSILATGCTGRCKSLMNANRKGKTKKVSC